MDFKFCHFKVMVNLHLEPLIFEFQFICYGTFLDFDFAIVLLNLMIGELMEIIWCRVSSCFSNLHFIYFFVFLKSNNSAPFSLLILKFRYGSFFLEFKNHDFNLYPIMYSELYVLNLLQIWYFLCENVDQIGSAMLIFGMQSVSI